ncbi:hypothetical protein [Mitsuokella multacida]|nr:hypothetical protein [Mitsuokella multacida]
MKATIEIDINAENKYGHTTLSFGPGNTIAADLMDDEFDSVSAITDALKEIMADYIEKDMRKKLEEEDD